MKTSPTQGCDTMAMPPPTCLEMGVFYSVLGAMECTTELGSATLVDLESPDELGPAAACRPARAAAPRAVDSHGSGSVGSDVGSGCSTMLATTGGHGWPRNGACSLIGPYQLSSHQRLPCWRTKPPNPNVNTPQGTRPPMLNVKKGFIAAHTFSILTRYAELCIKLPVR